MILGRIGEEIQEDFTILDVEHNLISGIDSTAFTVYLYSPNDSEVSSSIGLTFTELGNGHYRAKFIPNSVGIWYINIYHSIYFPWGKADTIQVFTNDFDTITVLLERILGMVQENFFIDNTTYNSQHMLTESRIRLYSNAGSVGTGSNVIATYNMIAEYDANELDMISYKVVKQ